MYNVYAVKLRAKNGKERSDLWWLPTEETRREFYKKVQKNKLKVVAMDEAGRTSEDLCSETI